MVVCRGPSGQGDTAINAGATGLIPQEIGILERAFLDRLVPDATQGLESAQKKVLLIQGDPSFSICPDNPVPVGQPFPDGKRAYISRDGGMSFLLHTLLADDGPAINTDLSRMPHGDDLRH